ncbi:putative peptidoglycan glycosyltransferase FtsW [Gleimia hominis]|uniref:Probable peptidoglycan glycosyltransferase FtsW n=1 Tax=Gleimia hominis TaxID=595468 RepID=A0ABU3ICI4_9ACTO|nr:putative peptidoglycan glycosyltransferase FtsW [Gleimia hominis]MDT3768094.1 putative peptidoglycan glycosyltransferase FtsW [Gleimia hominis]
MSKPALLKRLNLRMPKLRFKPASEPPAPPSNVTTYYMIYGSVLCLMFVGFIMVFSASAVSSIAEGLNPYLAYMRNCLIMVLGLVLFHLVARVPARIWNSFALLIFFATLGLQLLVLTPLGRGEGGNRNWLKLPGLPMVQPAEILKLGLILLLAHVLVQSRLKHDNLWHMVPNFFLPCALAIGAIMGGHDLGTALIFVAIILCIMLLVDFPRRWYWYLAGGGLFVVGFFVMQKSSRLARILSVIPGFKEPPSTHAPEQLDHAIWALGAGGLTGVGPGASREKWNYLAAAHTDFIYAILGEELGLIGAVAVLVCFGVLAVGMYRVIMHHSDPFARYVTAGVNGWIASHALVNMGAVVGLTPIIGVPLPLISTGGSAFVFTSIALGIVVGFARQEAGISKTMGVRHWVSKPIKRQRQPRGAKSEERAGQ